jgi:hypothetical protein
MTSYDDDIELDFFEEPETLESPGRRRRRVGSRGAGPRRPIAPPPGPVGLARLAGLVALAIVVVLGFVLWVGGGTSRHDEYASYLNSVRSIAQSSAGVGTSFANELGAANLTRTGLEAKLQQWAQLEQQNYAAAQRLRPPGPLQGTHQELLTALQLRAMGLAGLAQVLNQAGSKPAATVASALAGQAQLLSASDIVWSELVRQPATDTLTRLGVTGLIVPASQFVTNAEDVSSRSFAVVFARLGATSGGTVTGLHGSALVGTQAVGGGKTVTLSPSSPATVDVSADLVFRVTFVDSGNYPEVKIPVRLAVVVSGQKVYTKTQTVPQILAKRQQTVSFGNVQLPPAAFGHTSSVQVDVGKVPGEKQLDNNHAAYPVFFSLPTSG